MSARKRIRAALKERAEYYSRRSSTRTNDIASWGEHWLTVSDIEQILAENRRLRTERREALQKVHYLLRERGSLNTQLAAARAHQTVVIPRRPAVETSEIEALKTAAKNLLNQYPALQYDGLANGLHLLKQQTAQVRLPKDVSEELSKIMEDLGVLYESEAAATHLRRIRAALRGRLERIRHLEAENGKLKDRIPTDELAHAISERNAYKQALQTCAKVASGTEPLREVPIPDNLQALVCLELSRLHTIEEEIRGILA